MRARRVYRYIWTCSVSVLFIKDWNNLHHHHLEVRREQRKRHLICRRITCICQGYTHIYYAAFKRIYLHLHPCTTRAGKDDGIWLALCGEDTSWTHGITRMLPKAVKEGKCRGSFEKSLGSSEGKKRCLPRTRPLIEPLRVAASCAGLQRSTSPLENFWASPKKNGS